MYLCMYEERERELFKCDFLKSLLSRAQVPVDPLSGTGKKKKVGGGGGYKAVRAVRPESVAGGGWF